RSHRRGVAESTWFAACFCLPRGLKRLAGSGTDWPPTAHRLTPLVVEVRPHVHLLRSGISPVNPNLPHRSTKFSTLCSTDRFRAPQTGGTDPRMSQMHGELPRKFARSIPPVHGDCTRCCASIHGTTPASASSSFVGSFPPAWARSGRPPPRPPTFWATKFTRSPALIR